VPEALVLSGGGGRGDFELGAVDFIYSEGVRPQIICGTSVGAINGMKLAEGEGDPEQGLAGLKAIWFGLQRNTDMYDEEGWLSSIDPRISSYLTGRSASVGLARPAPQTSWGDLNKIINFFNDAGWLVTDGVAILTALEAIMSAKSLYNLTPIEERVREDMRRTDVAAWVAAGGQLRIGLVSLESGRLRYMTQTGGLLERDNVTPVRHPPDGGVPAACVEHASRIAELEETLAGEQADLVAAAPGEKGAIAQRIAALLADISREREALAECIRQNPPPAEGPPVEIDYADGVMASASIPGIFRAVPLVDGETYVDGGVRDVLPLQAAVDLGANVVYAVVASKADPEQAPSYRSGSMLEIAARALVDISISEVQRDDTRLGPNARTVHLIQPSVDIHDAFTIDPGLIRINFAYGYMRAADVVAGVPETSRRWQLADLIALKRLEIWRLECLERGLPIPTEPATPVRPADPTVSPGIAALKAELQALVDERRAAGGSMPGDADSWSQGPEQHPLPAGRAATFVSQFVPPMILSGQQATVSITMRNTGSEPWSTADGYRLGSQNPQDNTIWGLSRVEPPTSVQPNADVTLTFQVQAPVASGAFMQWQMLQEGVEWFGDLTPPIYIVTESPECAALRSEISDRDAEIEALRGAILGLDGSDPIDRAEIRAINQQIGVLEDEIAQRGQQMRNLGCPP
jgi:NTE family protein